MKNGKTKKFAIKVLTRNGVVKEYITLVDEEDATLLRSYFWTIINGASGETNGSPKMRKYVARIVAKGVHEYLHYRVLGIESTGTTKIYHINSDTLDNRKANLFNGAQRVQEVE